MQDLSFFHPTKKSASGEHTQDIWFGKSNRKAKESQIVNNDVCKLLVTLLEHSLLSSASFLLCSDDEIF
jgi:hypothetical protein